MWQGAAARIPEADATGVSRAAGRVGAGAAGDPRELPGEPGGDAADAADAVDSGVPRGVGARGGRWGRIFWWCTRGRAGKSSMEQAIATIVESVKQAARQRAAGRHLRILIENTAGMGTAVGSRLEEVAQIVRGLRGSGRGGVPGYGASVCGGIRHSQRGRAGERP